jgi:riboflavin biosynthesis pyrimidine reductase
MILEEIFPKLGVSHEVSMDNTQQLKACYPVVKGFRLNFVVSAEETFENSDASSNSLDRIILKFIRSQSDLILTSGKTARSESLRSSTYAPLLIITKTEVLFDIPAVTAESTQGVYLTQKLGTLYPNSKALAVGLFQGSPSKFAKSFCLSNNFDSIVLETGLSLSREFAEANQINEVDLTVTKVQSQEVAIEMANEFLVTIGIQQSSLLQLLRNEDSWFFRFETVSTR